MKHLPIGGSTAPRTLACPAWLPRSKNIPKSPAGPAADIGNLIHDVLENHYQHGTTLEAQIGVAKFNGHVFSEEHLELTKECVQATETVLDQYDIEEITCEPFVQIIKDQVGGSIDLLGVSADGKTVLVLDYKTGMGKVSAEDNKSILFYTLAASMDLTTAGFFKNATRFVSAIVQPKCYGTTADVWEFTKKELHEFEDQLMAAVDESQKAEPKAKTGKHCFYCPAAPFCVDKSRQAHSAMILDTSNAAILSEALELTDELEAWIASTKKAATELLKMGAAVPNYKLVPKRPTRKWGDAAAATEYLKEHLGEDAFKTDLITPPQAEKLLGKDRKAELTPFIKSVSSGNTLAKESDRRPAVEVAEISENILNLMGA